MNSLILKTTGKILLPILLIASVFILLRGHNQPGGGFIGGLIAVCGFSLHALGSSVRESRRILLLPPLRHTCIGLLLALSSGLISFFGGDIFMQSIWWNNVGTPLFFDCGVYFVVIGFGMQTIFTLMEDQ